MTTAQLHELLIEIRAKLRAGIEISAHERAIFDLYGGGEDDE